jgi:biopolymer transport protein ExbD
VPITFYCSECTQKLRIDDDLAGRLVACTRCGSRLRVPLESEPERPRRQPKRPIEGKAAEPPQQIQVAKPEPPPPRRPEAREEFAKPRAIEPVAKPGPPPVRLEPREEFAKPQAREAAVFEAPEREPAPEPAVQTATAVAARPRRAARGGRSKDPELALTRPPMSINFEGLIDMTAMVDIVFFLLIFFLVTSMKAIDSTVPMPAPDPQKAGAREPKPLSDLESDNESIVVHIDRNDRVTVNDAEVHNARDLLFKLRDLRTSGSRPDKLVVIGHGEATHGTAVMIMDTGREVGIENVRLAVTDESE